MLSIYALANTKMSHLKLYIKTVVPWAILENSVANSSSQYNILTHSYRYFPREK